MSDSSRLKKIPIWVWWSFFPTFGGLAIAYAGHRSNTRNWMYVGAGFVVTAIVLSSVSGLAPLYTVAWFLQIGAAFSLRERFLVKTLPRGSSIAYDPETARLIAETHGKLDINTCSKDELVRHLGLPIVYANEIEAARNEGFVFTHLEELVDVAGLPESYLGRIEPMVTFSYDYRKEMPASWRRINSLSAEELVSIGLDRAIAQLLTTERQNGGEYRSLIDIKRRTGIPFTAYQHLM